MARTRRRALPVAVILAGIAALAIGAIASGVASPQNTTVADSTSTTHSPFATTAKTASPTSSGKTATSPSATPSGDATTSQATASPSAPATAWTAELASLPVKAELPLTNYRRVADFGPAWADVDGLPCDTRDQILKRDLIAITVSGSCEVTSGTLHDPYTGKTIHFVRGVSTSAAVQIDHVVALANAWAEGAQRLSSTEREKLANDPIELWAVDGPTNESKGDGDASEWLPANTASDCTYVEKQITVKVKYDLWVTRAEHAAMAKVLATCTGGPASIPTPVRTVSHAPTVSTPAKPRNAPAAPATKTVTGIHPGSYCSVKGQKGIAASGRTYICGAKGRDRSGRYHWNV